MSNLIERWKALNRRHVQINLRFGEIYGGPDVSPKWFTEQTPDIAEESHNLYQEREKIFQAKMALENQMSDGEFDQIYS